MFNIWWYWFECWWKTLEQYLCQPALHPRQKFNNIPLSWIFEVTGRGLRKKKKVGWCGRPYSFLCTQLYQRNVSNIMSEVQALKSFLSSMPWLVKLLMLGLFLLVYRSFFFVFLLCNPFAVFIWISKWKRMYCYARIVHYSRLCFVPGTSLCHKQCDRLRHRKLNLSFFPPSTLSLTCSLPLYVCLSLFLSPNIYSAGHTFWSVNWIIDF